jgi:folate-binding Fe-S cluster repair protein YgfZ
MTGEAATDRAVLEIRGADREKFLQDLVTNDLKGLDAGLVYTALLSPQGKYLFDFFMLRHGDALLIDIASDRAAALAQRLNMYKLRADVAIRASALTVSRGLGEMPEGAMADPRHPALGWRLYGPEAGSAATIDWEAIRVEHLIPETGAELLADDSYILELGFERLHGVLCRAGSDRADEAQDRVAQRSGEGAP